MNRELVFNLDTVARGFIASDFDEVRLKCRAFLEKMILLNVQEKRLLFFQESFKKEV